MTANEKNLNAIENLDEYIDRQEECMADEPLTYAICVTNGSAKQIIDTFQTDDDLDASAAEEVLDDFFGRYPDDTPHGIYSVERIRNMQRIAVIYERDCDAE